MGRTLALTGATGFIGGALARELPRSGWQVRALVRPSSNVTPLLELGLEPIQGALEDLNSLTRLVDGAHAVVHCAGAVRGITRAHFNQVNVEGIARLVQLAAKQSASPRFLSVSSLAAREPGLSPYAASKRKGEHALATLAGRMKWLVLRPPAVYGPGDQELLPLLRWIGRGIAPILGPMHARVSMLYVDDLSAAVLKWLHNDTCKNGVFELHDGHCGGYSWIDVVDTAARMAGRPVLRVRIPKFALQSLALLSVLLARLCRYEPMLSPGKARELQHSNWVCDNTALSREIDWTPRVLLKQGLRRTPGWRGYQHHDHETDS